MPRYRVDAQGSITLSAFIEAETPEQARAKAAELHEYEWDYERDDAPSVGKLYLIQNRDTEQEFEILDSGELHALPLPPQFRGFSGKHLTIEDLLQLPHDEVLESDHTANKEGLTFKEWLAAAGIWHGPEDLEPLPIGSAYNAWYAGEDPTEWRAEHSNGEVIT